MAKRKHGALEDTTLFAVLGDKRCTIGVHPNPSPLSLLEDRASESHSMGNGPSPNVRSNASPVVDVVSLVSIAA
jgi:hypothetical protein